MTEETTMLGDDVRARIADFRRRYWITLTRGQVEALLTAGLDALTKAEADRDAYAAVAKIAVACVYNPHFLIGQTPQRRHSGPHRRAEGAHGVEDDPEGGIRCYLGARWKGVYCVVDDPDNVREIRRAWEGGGQHVLVPMPPLEHLYHDEAAVTETPA